MSQKLQGSGFNKRIKVITATIFYFALGVAIAIVGPLAGQLHASSWVVNADGNWSTTANWLGAVPNGQAAVADFSTIDITADRTITLDTSFTTYVTVGSLVFGDTNTATAGSWTIARSGTTTYLYLDNTGGSGDPTITVNALGAGKSAIITTPIGGLGLNKAGVGTLTLSGANTYTGNTTLSAGTLNINSATALGSSTFNINGVGTTIDNTSGNAITMTSNNAQNWNNDFTFTGTNSLNLGAGVVTLGGNRQVTVSAGTLTVGGNIAGGSYSLTKAGNGILTLSGAANAWTGGTNVTAGALVATSTAALPNWNGLGTGGPIVVSAGATLSASSNWSNPTDIDTLRASPNVTWTAGSFLGIDTTPGGTTYASNLAMPTVGFNKIGANTLLLTGSNTYGGGTKVTAGVMQVPTTASLPNWNGLGTGAISAATGATLAVPVVAAPGATDWSPANIATLQGNVTWALGSYLGIDTTATAYTMSNVTTANMGINKLGANTLIVNGVNTYNGGVIVSAGTLQMGSATALGAATGGLSVSGTLDLASYSPTMGSLSGGTSTAATGIITSTTAAATDVLTVDTSVVSPYYYGIITNGSATSLSLVKRGTGTITLATTAGTTATGSTYTGGTTIAGGTLNVSNNAANNINSNLGTGTITFQGGTLSVVNQSGSTVMTMPNAIFVDAGQTGTLNMPGRYTMTGAPSGGGSLTFNIAASAARDYFSNNWTAFTGNLYLTGNGRADLWINGGAYTALGMANTTVYIDGTSTTSNVQLTTMTNSGNGNEVALGAVASLGIYGHLGSGLNNSGGNTGLARYTIGGKNLDTVFQGTVDANTIINKTGTGKQTFDGPIYSTGNANYAAIIVNTGILQIGNGGARGSLESGSGRITNNATLAFNRTGTLVVPNTISGTGTTTLNGGGTFYLNGVVANNGGAAGVSVGGSGTILGGTGTIAPTTVAAGGGIEGGQGGVGVLTLSSLTYTTTGIANFTPSQATKTTAPLNITNALTTDGLANQITVNIGGLPLPTDTYSLIKYGSISTGGYSSFQMGTTPTGSGSRPKNYNLSNNSLNNEIDLVVTGADSSITWTGSASGSWDTVLRTSPTNWKYTNPVTGTSTNFYLGDTVTFDNSASTKTVTISSGDVTPASVTFSNTTGNDYVIQGTNGIGNGASLTMNGSGMVTISNNNSFTGATTINAGTISIASDGATAGAASPLGAVPSAVTPKSIVLNSGTLSASATMTLNANRGIVLGPVSGTGTGTIDVQPDYTATLTYAGVIANNYDNNGSSNSGLNKTGPGTLILNGANVYTGDTVISGGVLTLGNTNALQYSTLNYNNQGGTLTFAGTPTAYTLGGLKGAQDLAFNVALTIGNNNASNTFDGALSGSGALYKVGTGTQTLTNANNAYSGITYTGGWGSAANAASSTGSLVFSGSGSLNTYNTLIIGYRAYDFANIIFRDNAVANLGSITFGNNLASGGGVLTIQDNALVTVYGNINLSYTLGGGTVTNNTINLNGGTLSLGLPFTRTMQTDIRHQATINFNGGTFSGSGDLLPAFAYTTANVQAGGAKFDDGGNILQIEQPLVHDSALGATVDGGVHKMNSGTLILAGNNTYTGTTTIDSGKLQVGNNTASGLLGTGPVNNSGAIVLLRTDSFTMPNAIGGTGSLSQQGSGSTAMLTSPNTYTGATTVTAGTLILTGTQLTSGVTVSDGAGFGAGTGGTTVSNLALSGSTTLVPSDGKSLTTITVSGTNGLTNTGTATIAPGNIGAQSYAIGTTAVIDYNGSPITSGYSLSLPARVSGSLIYNTGNTSIDLNVTAIRYPRWTGAPPSGTVGDWDLGITQNWKEYSSVSTPTYYQESPAPDFVYFDDTATGTTTVNITTAVMPALISVNNNTKPYTFSGIGFISGTTSLNKTGTGMLTITNSGGNNYSGGTKISAGTLSFATGVLPATGAIIMDGGTLQWNGAANTDDVSNRLTFVSGKTAILDTNNNAVTFASTFSFDSTSALTKTGLGTLTLTGTNSTFTGNVNINGGVLAVNCVDNATYPGYSALGNPTIAGRNIVVNNGGTLRFDTSYPFGSAGTDVNVTLVVNAGGTVLLNNGGFAPIGSVVLNGGTLARTGDGTDVNHQGFWIRSGSVTVGGTSPSFITASGADSGFHLANPTTFNVADVTGDASTDLTVSAVLLDGTASGSPPYSLGSLTKTGAGTMTVTVNTAYTHNTNVNGGVLDMMALTCDNVNVSSGALNAVSINTTTLTIGSGATVTIKAIPGGPLSGGMGSISPVPEPATWAMLMLAAMGLGIYWRRSR